MPSFYSWKYACDVCTQELVMLIAKLNVLTSWHACSGLTTFVIQASLQALAQDQLGAERIQMLP